MASNDTSSDVGGTALLTCVGFGQPSAAITWRFNGAIVRNTPTIAIYEENVVQGSKMYRVSTLQLCNLQRPASGGYTCTVSNGFGTLNFTTQLTVSG